MPTYLDRVAHGLLAALVGLSAVALGVFDAAGLFRYDWGIVTLLTLVGALIARSRLAVIIRALAALSFVLLLVAAFTPLAGTLIRPYVRRDPAPTADTRLDAIVVLSEKIDGDGHLSEAALDRLLTGATLYRHGVSPRVVLSRTRYNRHTSDADQQRVLDLVADSLRPTIVDSVFSTRDEAERIARLSGVRRIALVTSPSHTRRACATFEQLGLDVVCVPSQSRDLPLSALDSAEQRLEAFRQWMYEALATIVYRMRGWI